MGKESLKIFSAAMILGASSVGITDNYKAPQADLVGFTRAPHELEFPQELRKKQPNKRT